ncbi:helix-turn-helix domain-containing protein [Thalassobacillus sp. CUG 92003]|uniref:helix-turn-helix domain-containing protein n=1 Tax=Thalassobacillus sp. CUG 92003 TaxID=2736641 RepID=UPI0015E6F1A1|nr:helix-turn-helix domain-containing protein [Thalassobacillus sp. CUG 92003]
MREWLIQIRKELNLTQEEVARGAHINRAYYTQIESDTRNPSMAVAKQISRFLNIDPSLFFTDHLSEPFQAAIEGSPITVAHCDLNLRFTWIYNPHSSLNPLTIIGKRPDDIHNGDGTNALISLKDKVIKTGKTFTEYIHFDLPDEQLYYYVFARPLLNHKGNIIGVATTSTNLTHDKGVLSREIPLK